MIPCGFSPQGREATANISAATSSSPEDIFYRRPYFRKVASFARLVLENGFAERE